MSHNRHSITDTQKAAQEQKMQMAEVVDKVKVKFFVYENEIKKQTELNCKNIADITKEERKMSETVDELIQHVTSSPGRFSQSQGKTPWGRGWRTR